MEKDIVEGTLSEQPDPLASSYGRPLVGVEGPGMRYLGRVIIELYEGEALTDEMGLVYSVDAGCASKIDANTLLQRIANALPTRLEGRRKK